MRVNGYSDPNLKRHQKVAFASADHIILNVREGLTAQTKVFKQMFFETVISTKVISHKSKM